MADRKSSKKLAEIASDVMDMAKHGGPVQHFKTQLEDEFRSIGVTNLDFLERIDGILRPYIDNAESLAASVLSQRAK